MMASDDQDGGDEDDKKITLVRLEPVRAAARKNVRYVGHDDDDDTFTLLFHGHHVSSIHHNCSRLQQERRTRLSAQSPRWPRRLPERCSCRALHNLCVPASWLIWIIATISWSSRSTGSALIHWPRAELNRRKPHLSPELSTSRTSGPVRFPVLSLNVSSGLYVRWCFRNVAENRGRCILSFCFGQLLTASRWQVDGQSSRFKF